LKIVFFFIFFFEIDKTRDRLMACLVVDQKPQQNDSSSVSLVFPPADIVQQLVQVDSCLEQIPLLSFKGIVSLVRITQVIDGNTCWAVFQNPFNLTQLVRYRLRLMDYTSPKIRTNLDAVDRTRGELARDYLEHFVMTDGPHLFFNRLIMAHFGDFDRVGRLYCRLFCRDTEQSNSAVAHSLSECLCLNKLMLDKGYGKPYDNSSPERLLVASEPSKSSDTALMSPRSTLSLIKGKKATKIISTQCVNQQKAQEMFTTSAIRESRSIEKSKRSTSILDQLFGLPKSQSK
jgi:hypothetical protein